MTRRGLRIGAPESVPVGIACLAIGALTAVVTTIAVLVAFEH